MAFDEDLSIFFDTEEHGCNVIKLKSGDFFAGIFDESPVNDLGMEVPNPELTCASNDVADLVEGDRLEIETPNEITGHRQYALYRDPSHDGTGLAVLTLKKV